MKIAIIGQQDFGRSVLESFVARGDQVAGVFCATEKEGAKSDRNPPCCSLHESFVFLVGTSQSHKSTARPTPSGR